MRPRRSCRRAVSFRTKVRNLLERDNIKTRQGRSKAYPLCQAGSPIAVPPQAGPTATATGRGHLSVSQCKSFLLLCHSFSGRRTAPCKIPENFVLPATARHSLTRPLCKPRPYLRPWPHFSFKQNACSLLAKRERFVKITLFPPNFHFQGFSFSERKNVVSENVHAVRDEAARAFFISYLYRSAVPFHRSHGAVKPIGDTLRVDF